MIGGIDRHFPVSGQRLSQALDSAAHAILRRWRGSVFQSGEGIVYPSLADVPLTSATELFVYRDQACLRDWEARGGTPENAATMIHLLAHGDGLTMVVGDPNEPVAAGVLKEFERLRFFGELPQRAA